MAEFITDNDRVLRQKELIEHMGRLFSKKGFQSLPGRVIGLLIFSDKDEFTFEEIINELQISKSSASVAINSLTLLNKIEYITHSGDRRRYFRIKQSTYSEIIEDTRKNMEEIYNLVREGLELKQDKNSSTYNFMSKYMKVSEYWIKQIEQFDTMCKNGTFTFDDNKEK
ncbi:MAG: hypothetical protein MJ211_01350 [Bacteroidales bacterium]|nr:hypothetical protein [Bacteroidales bacterium]